jgi:hypothetical protein
MHYMTHRFDRIKKHMSNVMCPIALLVESVPPKHKNCVKDQRR